MITPRITREHGQVKCLSRAFVSDVNYTNENNLMINNKSQSGLETNLNS